MKTPQNIQEIAAQNPIIAVVTIDDSSHAVPLVRTLLEAGIGAIELTLRTPAAFDSLATIRKDCPEMCAGLGTILTPEQVERAVAAGAAFGVAPGLNPRVINAAQDAGLPFAPGIATPSDIETAVVLGCRTLKFFPAEPSGGISYLKSMAAPYAHLGLRYIPLGGLNFDNFTDYLALDLVPAVGGSWIAPRPLIQAQDWSAIRDNAQTAQAKLEDL
ncbi:MAG: bifunctional 4-hydroxy-2-oxoglutarate aldolase/2-dehydro-3-deoxy-phosphogluconate aldolase [Verrucomicrobiae bacterium]|nr:bifunctional 4-hydroxy-2-oxoglutarate aldolase/2-dehydro-3-deoxy-phosphogluconate aldolase [Verrucomicrobiae bacterium]NNJ86799.1 bifunctional 4-hydroxy-2-oxoglutarate aldolase/2-dehydro-3-deoxy-phosphogluconate aldolase [Akkermansiaceae bacterium]